MEGRWKGVGRRWKGQWKVKEKQWKGSGRAMEGRWKAKERSRKGSGTQWKGSVRATEVHGKMASLRPPVKTLALRMDASMNR